jgi:hypothetical protein
MSTQSKKQTVAGASKPLLHAGLLELILGFVGGNQALYVRPVNSSWMACYDKTTINQQGRIGWHVHTSFCTSYRAVLASASRVRLAHDAGLLFSAKYSLEHCAGKHANTSTLEAAHKLGLPFSSTLLESAARSRCFSKLQWLYTEQRCLLPKGVTAEAARAGDVEMLRWLQGIGCELTEETSAAAASTANNLEVLKFLHEQGCPWHRDVCESAAYDDDLEQLKWLHAHGAVIGNNAANTAAEVGAARVLEWLQQQQGVEFTACTMAHAAMFGHVQVCQWLRAQQCPWDSKATGVAASGNYCETLRWLIENGCPYDDAQSLCIAAASGSRGDFSTLQYLYDCGIIAEPDVLTDVLKSAGANSTLAVVQWLRQLGAEWPAMLCDDVWRAWKAETLAWARAEGCTSPTEYDWME